MEVFKGLAARELGSFCPYWLGGFGYTGRPVIMGTANGILQSVDAECKFPTRDTRVR